MSMEHLIAKIKAHPRAASAGMILCHNGIVRGTSRDGRPVSGLTVHVDSARLKGVIDAGKRKPGIIEILVEIKADRKLSVGDDVMFLVVAGDIRENVICALQETLDAIKSTVTQKTEYFMKA